MSAPDADDIKGFSPREQEALVDKVREADEKLVEVINTIYEIKERLK